MSAETAAPEALRREHQGTRPPGTYAAYRLDGCRCYPCSAVRSAYDDRRTRALIAGTWRPFVDAAPVRAHLTHLSESGVGLRRIASLTGMSRVSLQRIRGGCGSSAPRAKVRTEHAEAILAIQPGIDTVSPGVAIDATGSHRRIHALVAAGFPGSYLADRLGMVRQNLDLEGARPSITAEKARAIRELYAALSAKDPAHLGVLPSSVTRARNLAAARGWPRPIDWDDDEIDDPAATPHLDDLAPGGARTNRAALAENARFLVQATSTDLGTRRERDAIAERLGISTDYLNKLLKEAA